MLDVIYVYTNITFDSITNQRDLYGKIENYFCKEALIEDSEEDYQRLIDEIVIKNEDNYYYKYLNYFKNKFII